MPGSICTIALRNVSWHCVKCGLPNFSSCLFDLTFYESANTFDPLQLDSTTHSMECDTSFNNPCATSSPNKDQNLTRGYLHCDETIPCTTMNSDANLTHPSLSANTNNLQNIHTCKQKGKDVPLKVLNINCQSVIGKKTLLEVICENIGANIVIGTESWLTANHQSSEFFPRQI